MGKHVENDKRPRIFKFRLVWLLVRLSPRMSLQSLPPSLAVTISLRPSRSPTDTHRGPVSEAETSWLLTPAACYNSQGNFLKLLVPGPQPQSFDLIGLGYQ